MIDEKKPQKIFGFEKWFWLSLSTNWLKIFINFIVFSKSLLVGKLLSFF